MSNIVMKDLKKQIMHTVSLFKKDESFNDDRFMKVRIAAMHSGINRNKSRFSKECIEAAKDTFANIPVLADVREYEDEDGNKYLDYAGHTMHIEDDVFNEDMERIIYDEKVVGIVPETNNFELIYDEETGNYYVYIDALLYRDYGNYVCDILEARDNKTDVSMEIGCDDISFCVDDGCLDVGVMVAGGVTLLGERYNPGMVKAHAQAFSINEDDKQAQLIKIMQELKESLDNYTLANSQNENQRKEDNKVGNNEEIFEEVTVINEGEVTEGSTDDEVTVVEEKAEVTTEETPEVEENEPEVTSTDDTDENFSDNGEDETEKNTFSVEKSVLENGNYEIKFEISHEDLRWALYNLIDQYDSLDNDWYSISAVYDEYFVMESWSSGMIYGQKYTKDGDSVALDGERYRLYRELLTESEKAELESMRSNYSEIKIKLEKFEKEESDSLKATIFEKKEYKNFLDTEEFKNLKADSDKYSYEELSEKAELAFSKCVQRLGFSLNDEEPSNTPVAKKNLPYDKQNKKKSRYGSIFSN